CPSLRTWGDRPSEPQTWLLIPHACRSRAEIAAQTSARQALAEVPAATCRFAISVQADPGHFCYSGFAKSDRRVNEPARLANADTNNDGCSPDRRDSTNACQAVPTSLGQICSH